MDPEMIKNIDTVLDRVKTKPVFLHCQSLPG
jgi:hypothetical protein